MQSKLDIQTFIEQHGDWEKILCAKPYYIHIQHDRMFGRRLVLLKYSLRESDFSIPLVRECRGLILDEDTLEPVCVPFFKFFNYGEPHADDIDWKTAWTSEKMDGVLIKVVRLGNDFLISTNGTIDAFKAPVQESIAYFGKSFGDLFMLGMQNAMNQYESRHRGAACFDWVMTPQLWMMDNFKEGFTYMFELTSPYSKIVVSWAETKIFFIGCRDNRTFEEIRFFEHGFAKLFSTPEVFQMRNVEECVSAAEKLDRNHEGFVVCDADFRRLKVKSPLYVSLHHMKNNGVLSFERGVDIIRENELDEVLTYFPEFSAHLLEMKARYEDMATKLKSAWQRFLDNKDNLPTRKEQAKFIMSEDCFGRFSGLGFALLDNRVPSVDHWLKTTPAKTLARLAGYGG